MNRRAILLMAVTLGLFAAPLPAAPSDSKVYRIGYFVGRGPDPVTDGAFLQGLRDLGYIEGKNIIIERRYADGKAERFPALAADLAEMKLDLIVVAPIGPALAMKRATHTTPIVMANAGEPVSTGLVASLAHPGGNVTGLSNVSTDLIGKEMELLKEAVPDLSRVAFLVNGSSPLTDIQLREAQSGVRALGLRLVPVKVRDATEYAAAFAAFTQAHTNALVINLDPMFFTDRQRLAELAATHRLPAISMFREFAEAGGLMTYGANLADMFRRSATYVDKILKGANPADLPVEQPIKLDLVVNLKTAKALGITIPQSILVRADEVLR